VADSGGAWLNKRSGTLAYTNTLDRKTVLRFYFVFGRTTPCPFQVHATGRSFVRDSVALLRKVWLLWHIRATPLPR
jgi:hypothetical protein